MKNSNRKQKERKIQRKEEGKTQRERKREKRNGKIRIGTKIQKKGNDE